MNIPKKMRKFGRFKIVDAGEAFRKAIKIQTKCSKNTKH